MRVDCIKTKNYFKEKARMTNKCKISCSDCPLEYQKNGYFMDCNYLELEYPEKAIEIVQKWSDEHPIKTWEDRFRESFPNMAGDLMDNISKLFVPCDFFGYAEAKGKDWDDVCECGEQA